MKRLVLALAFLALPAVATAACYGGHQQAQSCAEGSQWDPETSACVPVVTG